MNGPTHNPSLARALNAARETKFLDIGTTLLPKAADIFRRAFGDRAAVIVSDAITFDVAGRAVADSFVSVQKPFIFTDPALYAEHSFVEQVEKFLAAHDAIPIAVGAGTINDLVKLAAHRAGRRYMAVATAASMDGYTAFGASITHRGAKQTFSCPAPLAVVADLDVIAAAPPALNASGYADLLGKITAGADWIVADAMGVEPIDATAWELVQTPLRGWLADPAGVRTGKLDAIARLVEGLMMSGFAMQAHRSSRPASGAEHQFSHLWDMQHHTHEGLPPSHGFKVGVGALAIARLYEKILQLPLQELNIDRVCQAWPDRKTIEQTIRDLFPDPQLADTARTETLAKHPTRDELRNHLMRLRDVWPDLRLRLSAQLIPAHELARMLAAAGAPTDSQQIGISPERLASSFRQAYHIRRRYTVLDLAMRAEILEESSTPTRISDEKEK